MRRLALAILLLAAASLPLRAQVGAGINGQAIGPTGVPVPHALVTVCPYTAFGKPCSPQTQLYADVNLTVKIGQPFSADLYGNFTVFANPGAYIVQTQVAPGIYYSQTITANASGSGNVGGSGTITFLSQWTGNTTTLGNSPAYAQSNVIHIPSLEGSLYAYEWQTTPTSNNGIAMSIAECATYPYACQWLAPALYATTEAQPWGGTMQMYSDHYIQQAPPANVPLGGGVDSRFGGPEWMGTSLPTPSWVNDPFNRFKMGPSYTIFNTTAPLGLSGYTAPPLQTTVVNVHGSRSTTAGIGDQNSVSGLSNWCEIIAPASVNCLRNDLESQTMGDALGIFSWISQRGGPLAGDNEGTEHARLTAFEAPDVYQGTVNSVTAIVSGTSPCTAPCWVLNTTQTQGSAGGIGEQLPVIDLTRGFSTGLISLISGNVFTSTANWDSQFGDSNAVGATAANISNTTGGSSTENTFPQTNVTVSISTSSGTWNTTAPVCIFDSDGISWECDPVTAASSTSLTFAVVTLPHFSGALITQGGMTGMGIRMTQDCVGPGNMQGIFTGGSSVPINTICSTFPIEYNSSGNTAHVISGNRGGWATGTRSAAQMGSGGSVTATVAGGIVTGCTASGGSGYSVFSDVNGYMTNPPLLTYTVNAGGTPPVLALGPTAAGVLASCIVINPGTALTAVTVAVTPTNPYVVYPMARAQNVWNPTTGKLDGSSIAVDAGSGISAFQNGDTIEQEHAYQMSFQGFLQSQAMYQTGGGGTDGYESVFGGLFGGNQYAMWMINSNQNTLYSGFPAGATPWVLGQGLLDTPSGYTLSGPYARGFWLKEPPYSFKSLTGALVVGCFDYTNNTNICSKWTKPYNMILAENANTSGAGEDVLQYSIPTTTWSLTAGATNQSGFGALCTWTHGPTGMTYNCPFNLYGVVSGLLSNWAPWSNLFSGSTWSSTGSPTVTTGVADQWGGTSATTFATTAATPYSIVDTYTPTPLTASTNYAVCVYGHHVSGTNQYGLFAGAGNVSVLLPTTGWGPTCATLNSGSSSLTRIFGMNMPAASTTVTIEGITVSLASSPSAGFLYTGATPLPTPTQGLSPAFCINGNGCALSSVSINGSTPVTAINGGGTALPSTSDTTTTTGHVVTEQNVTGEYGDSGIAINSLCQTSGTNCPSSLNPPVTITTTAAVTISGTSGYYFNQEATAATAVTYTLPAPVAGYQFCVKNSNNGTAATTGVLELLVANTGTQSIIYNGTKSTSGFFSSSGAAGDFGCVIGISATQWEATASVGSWAIH